MAESLKKNTLLNIGYNSVAKLVSFAFQGLANIVLSQNLGASDYGIVGFAMIFVNFLARFNDMGIQSAVIRIKEVDSKTLYTAFTAKAILGVFMYLVTFVVAGFAPFFFENTAVVVVIRLIALNFIINTFAFLPKVHLSQDLDFKKISATEMCMNLTSSAVAVVLALMGCRYWSIVIASLASNVIGVVIINYLRPVKFSLNFDLKIARQLVRFGGNIFLVGLLTFFVFNSDNFIVGSVAGASALGYYALAFNWGSLICVSLGDVVNSVLFPTFSNMQDDRERLKSAYLRVLEYASFAAVLVNLILFLGSEDFLFYILGKGTEKWLPALVTFRIMCVYGMIRAILEPIGSVVMAIGKSELLLKANLLAAIIELSLLYPAIKFFGIEGVAILIIIAYSSQYYIFFSAIRKECDLSIKEVYFSVIHSILPATVVIFIYINFTHIYTNNIANKYLSALMLLTLYLLSHGLMSKWKIYKYVLNTFNAKLVK